MALQAPGPPVDAVSASPDVTADGGQVGAATGPAASTGAAPAASTPPIQVVVQKPIVRPLPTVLREFTAAELAVVAVGAGSGIDQLIVRHNATVADLRRHSPAASPQTVQSSTRGVRTKSDVVAGARVDEREATRVSCQRSALRMIDRYPAASVVATPAAAHTAAVVALASLHDRDVVQVVLSKLQRFSHAAWSDTGGGGVAYLWRLQLARSLLRCPTALVVDAVVGEVLSATDAEVPPRIGVDALCTLARHHTPVASVGRRCSAGEWGLERQRALLLLLQVVDRASTPVVPATGHPAVGAVRAYVLRVLRQILQDTPAGELKRGHQPRDAGGWARSDVFEVTSYRGAGDDASALSVPVRGQASALHRSHAWLLIAWPSWTPRRRPRQWRSCRVRSWCPD